MEALERAVQDDPKYADAFLELGNAYARVPGQSDRALTQFQRAATLEPRRPDAFINAGNVNIFLGRTDNAESFYKQVLSSPARRAAACVACAAASRALGSIHALHAQSHSCAARSVSLMRRARQALQLDPGNMDATVNLGVLLAQTGQPAPPRLPPVLIGHVSSLPPYLLDTSRPSPRTYWTRLVPPPVLIGHLPATLRRCLPHHHHRRAAPQSTLQGVTLHASPRSDFARLPSQEVTLEAPPPIPDPCLHPQPCGAADTMMGIPPPVPRTNRTSLVPPLVLTGQVSSLPSY